MSNNHSVRRAQDCALTDTPNDSQKVFKRYRLPDGTILELTKEEFDQVLGVFLMLCQQDEKLKAMRAKTQGKESSGSNVPFSSFPKNLK